MRLASIETLDGPRPGAIVADPDGVDRVVDLGTIAQGRTLAQLLADATALTAVQSAVAHAEIMMLPRRDTMTLAPPVRPGKILCLGYNYEGHLAPEPGEEPPPFPNVFVKTPNTVGGPEAPVVLPRAATQVDYEGEIAIVIGRTAHDVAEADAMGYVAGYTLLNDVSDRDWQSRVSQWELGKSFDGFCPLGPWIVTTDEVPDLPGRDLEVERGGVVTVRSNTSHMVYGVAFLVHYLSQVMTLEPGDIISTGTPARLPEAQSVHVPLTPGEVVTIRVTGLGELTTTFISSESKS